LEGKKKKGEEKRHGICRPEEQGNVEKTKFNVKSHCEVCDGAEFPVEGRAEETLGKSGGLKEVRIMENRQVAKGSVKGNFAF